MGIQLSTFSIVGYEQRTHELGVAVQSKFLAAASVVPFCQAGVGAIATQALANTSYGPKGLALLKEGRSPEQVVEILTKEDRLKENRQLGIVDFRGEAAVFTGSQCLPWAGGVAGDNFAAQGNLLVGEETIKCMANTFMETGGTLAQRLLHSLLAGQQAGGDRRGCQSAGLLVVKEKGGYGGFNDHYIDLRVDDHPTPIKELDRLLKLFYLYFGEEEGEFLKIEGELALQIKEHLRVLGYLREKGDDTFHKALMNFYFMENFQGKKRKDGFMHKGILRYMGDKVKENLKS